MTYDEMYPDTEVGVEPIPGVVRVKEEVNCANCGELCFWHCKQIDVPSCSMECHHASTQEYLEVQRDAWITESLVKVDIAIFEDTNEDPVASTEALLRLQHNATITRLVEWAKSEQLMLFYCDAPANYPFEDEIPILPIKAIEWERVLAVVSAPVEEPATTEELIMHEVVTDSTSVLVAKDDIESEFPLAVEFETTDPLGDEDEEDVLRDGEVWMGNDVPYVQGEETPEPVDLRAFAARLEEEDSD